MKRRILWTFLISGVFGWAVAHFTVGNAGAIALRAAVSEGRMRFSSAEQRSAASRLASLKGKSAQEQAAIIAGWWEITSVSELRHLYSLLREVPREFQDEARAILLGRWAMLEPDSLLLQATREGTAGKIAVMQAFSRHWAAGRSPEEIADMAVNAVGDVRKFVPEMRTGGRYEMETALAAGNAIHREFGLDGRVLLELARRLDLPMPMDGYLATFSALTAADPAEARRQLELIKDPDARHAATLGMASRLADTDPAAALALCESGGKDIVRVVAPAYLKHLLKLPPAEAWQKAGEFTANFGNTNSNAMSLFIQRMSARDPSGLVPFLEGQNSANRGLPLLVAGITATPAATELLLEYAGTEGFSQAGQLSSIITRNIEIAGVLDQLDNRDAATRVSAANTMLSQAHLGLTLRDTARLLEMSAESPLSYRSIHTSLGSEDPEDWVDQGLAKTVARQWPDSANLLETLSPAARAQALPGFLSGVAAADPHQAARLLAAEPDSPATAAAAAQLAGSWAANDLQAALTWADSLPPAQRTAARTGMKEQLEKWGADSVVTGGPQ